MDQAAASGSSSLTNGVSASQESQPPRSTDIPNANSDSSLTTLEAVIRAAVQNFTRSQSLSEGLPSADHSPLVLPTTSPSTSSLSAIGVRIVPLTSQEPRLWFHMVEAQFELSRITNEVTKYHHLLCALNEKVSNEVCDIITGPLSTTPYTDLKKAILSRLGESRQTQIHRLLRGIELGDKKPSQLLRQLKASGGSAIDDDLVKTIWLKRLPTRAQEILAPTAESLPATELAELADRILETMSQANVSAVSSPALNTFQSDMMQQINAIMKRLDQMETSNANRSRNGRRSRGHSSNRAPSRSPTPGGNSDHNKDSKDEQIRLCFYHFRFNDAARNCRPNCPQWQNFKSKN